MILTCSLTIALRSVIGPVCDAYDFVKLQQSLKFRLGTFAEAGKAARCERHPVGPQAFGMTFESGSIPRGCASWSEDFSW